MKTPPPQKIWIIGASSGIGAALASALDRRGAALTLSARRERELADVSQKLARPAVIAPLDVTDAGAVADAARAHGPFDSVIFLAAVYAPGLLEDMDITNAHRVMDINIGGALNVIAATYPAMKAARRGQIVLCGSVAGYRGLPNGQPYSMTKAALMNLAQSLKAEAGAHGVDVKLLSPGFVRTPMTEQNDFAMPMAIEADEAAQIIADALATDRFEIHFPKKFTLLMKLVSIMPYRLYFPLARRLLRKRS